MVTTLSKLPRNTHADDILEEDNKNDYQKRKPGKGMKINNAVNKHKINNEPTPMYPTHGLSFAKKYDDNITGRYGLKYINLFTKGTNLSNTIELYLKPNYPLILKYSVANLGEIRFCLAPKAD